VNTGTRGTDSWLDDNDRNLEGGGEEGKGGDGRQGREVFLQKDRDPGYTAVIGRVLKNDIINN